MSAFDPELDGHRIRDRFRGFLPVVIDVETSGFDCRRHAILEIAASVITVDAKGFLTPDEVLQYQVTAFEGAELDPASLEFTGIDPDNPLRKAQAEAVVFGELFKHIRQRVKAENCTRAILVGHNAHFDLGFVMASAERCNIKRNPFHPFSVFDTVALAALGVGHTVLARSCELASIDFNNAEAHSAAYDVEKTAELFCHLINRWQAMGGWRWPDPE